VGVVHAGWLMGPLQGRIACIHCPTCPEDANGKHSPFCIEVTMPGIADGELCAIALRDGLGSPVFLAMGGGLLHCCTDAQEAF